MATTAPDGLISPDASDPYDLTSDMAAMQASTQAALTNRASKSGTNSQMLSASGVQTGTLWFNTTDNRLYRFNGTGWDGVAPTTNSIQTTWVSASEIFSFTNSTSALGSTLASKIGRQVNLSGGLQRSGGFPSGGTEVGTLAIGELRPGRSVVLPATVNNGSSSHYPGAGLRIESNGALTIHNYTSAPSYLVGFSFSGGYVAVA